MSPFKALRKLPRSSALVVVTSALLFALGFGLVHLDRGEDPAERSSRLDMAEIDVRAPNDGLASDASATEAIDRPSRPRPESEWSKWGPENSDDLTWSTGEDFEDDPDGTDLRSLDCVIEPHRLVSIRSPVRGMIDAIHFERSDVVEEGDVLIELESGVESAKVDLARLRAEVNATVRSRKAALELSKRRSERAERLYASNALSLDLHEEVDTQAELARFELQQAADQNRIAKLEHEEALERLKQRTIRSPISGVVIERLMSAGEVVDDETILRLAQIDPLAVEIVLPAESFGSIVPGTKAAIIPEIPGDEVHMGSVTIVDRVVDAASDTFGARLELANPEGAIPSGLHCQVRFLDD